MCQACRYPDLYLTIPSAHERSCAFRLPYLKFEMMSAIELQRALPELVKTASTMLASFGEGKATIESVRDAMRASRACSDALARFAPRKQHPVGAANAARSWK